MDPLDDIRAVIVGHSHVSWLEKFIKNDSHDEMGKINLTFGIYKENIEVKFCPKPGATMGKILTITPSFLNLSPHIVVLVIGGNDLDRSSGEPVKLAVEVVNYAKELLSKGVKFVVLCEIPQRFTNTPMIGEKIKCYNSRLHAICKAEPNIRYWEHRRLRTNIQRSRSSVLRPDGVHLNNKGNYFLYHSLKNALCHAMTHVFHNSPCVHDLEYEKRGGTKQRNR